MRKAPSPASLAAPEYPGAPPTTSTWPKLPLCPSAGRAGSFAAAARAAKQQLSQARLDLATNQRSVEESTSSAWDNLVAARQALEINRRVMGPEHGATLNSMNYLAGLYFDQGRSREAEALYRETHTRSTISSWISKHQQVGQV